MSRSNYAGMPGGGQLQPYVGRLGDAKIAEQAILSRAVLTKWEQHRKDALRKYRGNVMSLRRVRDEVNEDLIENKRFIGKDEMAQFEKEFNERCYQANELQKALVEDYRQAMMKAGLTTSVGYNFYDLRGPAYLIYPVNAPFRNMLPRWGRVNAGVGLMANWKYTYLSPGTSYAGASEGQRVAYATPGEANAFAQYKELGVERSVSFTAEFAGEGYTDNVSDEHIRGLHELYLQQEGIILGGNPGTGTAGQNGFQLGVANTPSLTRVAALPAAPAGNVTDGGSGYATNTNVGVRVVELTMLGYPNNSQYGYQAAPTVAAGMTPSFTRTNADNTTNPIAGGMGAISAPSNIVVGSTSYPWVLAQVKPKPGAFAWAWFVDNTDSSGSGTAANAFLTAITTVPFIYLGGAPLGTYAGNSTGLSTDNSAQTLDYAGIIAWAINNGVFTNMSDLTSKSPVTGVTNTGLLTPGLTSVGGASGTPAVAEIEYDLKNQWNALQTVADEIWCSADAKLSIAAALFANTSGVPAYRFEIQRDSQGNILGGFTVSGYKSQYSMKATGSEELPLRIHPMLAPGTILYHKNSNPYPHSRIPGVSGIFVQRDYYGIEWPIVTRAWTFGTYVHEVYGNYIPALLNVRTGIIGAS